MFYPIRLHTHISGVADIKRLSRVLVLLLRVHLKISRDVFNPFSWRLMNVLYKFFFARFVFSLIFSLFPATCPIRQKFRYGYSLCSGQESNCDLRNRRLTPYPTKLHIFRLFIIPKFSEKAKVFCTFPENFPYDNNTGYFYLYK